MNMSYCMFQNTDRDLSDCIKYIEELNLSDEENEARINLINRCVEVAEMMKFKLLDGQSIEDYFKDNKEEFK